MIKKKVLIVDDHIVVSEGLAMLLKKSRDYEVCGSAKSAYEGLEQVGKLQPDVVLVDLSLENSFGLDLIKDIKQHYPDIPSIVISMHEESMYAVRAIRAGSKGYIMKNQPFDKIIEALQTALRGELYISEKIQKQLITQLISPKQSQNQSPVELLSDRELEVFQLIGQGIRSRIIADRLCISINTIETHCKRIRVKLNISSMVELVEYATQWLINEKT